jgi:hypothetical protein
VNIRDALLKLRAHERTSGHAFLKNPLIREGVYLYVWVGGEIRATPSDQSFCMEERHLTSDLWSVVDSEEKEIPTTQSP